MAGGCGPTLSGSGHLIQQLLLVVVMACTPPFHGRIPGAWRMRHPRTSTLGVQGLSGDLVAGGVWAVAFSNCPPIQPATQGAKGVPGLGLTKFYIFWGATYLFRGKVMKALGHLSMRLCLCASLLQPLPIMTVQDPDTGFTLLPCRLRIQIQGSRYSLSD